MHSKELDKRHGIWVLHHWVTGGTKEGIGDRPLAPRHGDGLAYMHVLFDTGSYWTLEMI